MMNMVKDIKEGDLKLIDFDCLNVTLKINWLKSWLKQQLALLLQPSQIPYSVELEN